MSAQKALQKFEIEMRELMGGAKKNNIVPEKGFELMARPVHDEILD